MLRWAQKFIIQVVEQMEGGTISASEKECPSFDILLLDCDLGGCSWNPSSSRPPGSDGCSHRKADHENQSMGK